MTDNRTLRWFLFAYLALVFVFIFAPIFFSVVFSFNSDRFPTIPLGNFTLKCTRQSGTIRMSGRRRAPA